MIVMHRSIKRSEAHGLAFALVRFIVVACGVLVCAPLGAEEPPAKPAATAASSADELSREQQQISEKYQRFEEVLVRMAELTAPTDPKRAALLRKAVAESKHQLIGLQLDKVADLLSQDRLSVALTNQGELNKDLNELLNLLLTEEREKGIKDERAKLKEQIRRVNELINKERQLQGQTAGGGEMKRLAENQGRIASDANRLADELRRPEDTAGDPKDTPPDGADAKDAQGGKEGKDSDGKKSPAGDKERSDGQAQDGKQADGAPQDKQDQADGKEASGDPKDGASKDGQAGEPKQSDGKQGDGKEADGKQGDAKESDSQGSDPKGADKEKESADGKDATRDKEASDKEKDATDEPSEKNDGVKPQDGKNDSEGGKGEAKKGKQQKGQPQEGQQQGGDEGQQDENDQQNQDQNQSQDAQQSARKRVKAAQDKMQSARQKLEKAQREGAVEDEEAAIRELEQAKADLEEILRQLREEELERMLAMLEGRFRKMLQAQLEVYEGTKRVDHKPAEERDHNDEIEAGRLSRRESLISLEAEAALNILREEGSAVAFPEAVEQMREDMDQVVRRLAGADVGEITQGIEEDVIAALEEMIESLQKAQQDLEKQKQQKQQQQQQQDGQPEDPPLIDDLAELKMIRSLQMRINTRTKRLARMVEGEVGQAERPELLEQLQRLAEREQSVFRVTRDIVTGRNR